MSKVREILEQNNLLDTRWGKRLLAMEKRGRPTKREEADAKNWQTCACGKQDKRIPRVRNGRPLDCELESFGYSFYWRIYHGQFEWAAELLVKIEQRASQILKKVGR
jgi:hypothetical protein